MARTIQDTDPFLLRELVDQSPLAIQVLSPDGRIRHVNRAWERLWGTTLDRVHDYNMLEDPQLEAAGIASCVRRAFAGSTCEAPEVLYDPDTTLPGRSDPAEPRWVRGIFYPVRDGAGKVEWIVLVQEDTTRRHELEEEAREAAARFRAIAELTSDYAYSFRVEPGGETTLEWVSVSTTAVLGMSREEILATGWRGLIPAEDHAAVREHMRRVVRGENDSVDHGMVGRDGRTRWVTSTSHVVRDPSSGRVVRVYGVSRDVTERMRAEGERDRFFALSLDMLAVAGVDGYFRRVNPAMERTLGYAAEELLARPFFDFIHPDDRAATRGEVEKLERGEHSVAFENRYRCADGSYRWLAWNSSPSVADGLLYCAARDITDQKRSAEMLERAFAGERAARAEAEAARQKLHEANELEQKARAAAEAANRTKDEFLAVLGHELRNPIGAIRTAARVLERLGLPEGESDERKNLLGLLTRQTHMLGRLVDDLLEVSRFGSGKIVLRRVPVELGEICGAALASFEAAGNLSRHVVSTDLRPARVEGDPERLEQIVGNLLENAVKYTPEGGRISVRVAEENGQAVLRVRDEGRGIAPEMLSRIFDFFVQGEPSLDRSRGGLGIGLTLVERLVTLHGGTVEAASAGLGHGSEFIVRVPLAVETRAAPTAAAEERSNPGQLRLLLVEDFEDAREALCQLLELMGHAVEAAADGRRALELALAGDFDAAIVDIGLPELDGYQVAERIRANGRASNLFLVALTGYGQPEERRRALTAGFDAHLVKPVDPEQLTALLAGNLPRR